MASSKKRQLQRRKRNCRPRLLLDEVQKRIGMLKHPDQLLFSQLLEEDVIKQIVEELGCGDYRDRIYTPHVTLAAFLGQAISDDGSCQQAVHRINKHRCSLGLQPASIDTNSYCTRHRLPEELFLQLLQRSSDMIQRSEPQAWLWKNRRVVLVDGCTTRAADTKANQRSIPPAIYSEARTGLSASPRAYRSFPQQCSCTGRSDWARCTLPRRRVTSSCQT